MGRQLAGLERGELARQSLEEFGAVILARDADEACALGRRDRPGASAHRHATNAERLAEKISHAGAIFLGNFTPVALGDYAAGPSHVLPTSGTARFASGLTANDFLRSTSLMHFTRQGMMNLGPRRAGPGDHRGPDGAPGKRGDKDEGGRIKDKG